jgi:protein SCO1/2
MHKVLSWLGIAALAATMASCGRRLSEQAANTRTASTNVQIYSVKGVVKELKPDGRTVVIKHEEIPNYMPAMTMPFEVKEAQELAGLQAGDEVTFRMLVTDTDGWIDQIRKVGASAVEPQTRETVRRVRIVDPLKIGDAIPDYPFTNELNQPISLGQFKGQALALTFIFTRCPFPNFCPRMSSNFAEAYKKLSTSPDGATNWHLLSISFDPEFDTPAVLKGYAKRYQYDTNHWSFATGAWIEIDAITEQFGLEFSRSQTGIGWDHKLRTVVIDAAGKVQKVYAGNEWKVDDLVDEMVKAAKTK